MDKGFTLVELLAVIVLLSAIALIVTISTNYTIDNSKTKLSEIQIEKIEKAAELYYLKEGSNDTNYGYNETKTCVNVEYLIENDYIESEEIKNPKDYNQMLGSVKIMYESGIYTYNYKDTKCNSNDYDSVLKSICTPVTEKTKTTGNIPQGNYLPGDEYICEVKPGIKYRFFVLSTNNKEGEIITRDSEDKKITSVNLIMERNIYYDKANDVGVVATSRDSIIAWYEFNPNHSYGPVTAMTYLHNATKDWSNVPSMIMNYEDENIVKDTQQKGTSGYGSIITTGTTTIITSKTNEETGRIENLKTRMPRYDEVHGTGKCLTYAENGNKCGSCPLWLSNYLAASEYVTGEGLQNISGISGYWTLSSFSASGYYSGYAWNVFYHGYVNYASVELDYGYGVRPVITLEA